MPKLLILVVAFFCLSAQADDANPISNFHTVLDGKIFRGARPGDAGINYLATQGLKTIVDLQGGDYIGPFSNPGESKEDIAEESAATQASGMKFISAPMNSLNPDFDDQTPKVGEILGYISDPANQPVFFHCFHGEDRTGVIAALYRVVYQGCSADLAHQEMLDDGHSKMLFWIDNYFFSNLNTFQPASASLTSPCPLTN